VIHRIIFESATSKGPGAHRFGAVTSEKPDSPRQPWILVRCQAYVADLLVPMSTANPVFLRPDPLRVTLNTPVLKSGEMRPTGPESGRIAGAINWEVSV
jgi:hypothetical protein